MRNESRSRLWGRESPRRLGAIIAAFALLPALAVAVSVPDRAQAALPDPATFDPGNIISDANFYDGTAMTEAEIQAFLASRGSVLSTYRSSVSSRPIYESSPGNIYCHAFEGGSNLLASTIIFRVQAACGISAKALLVTLQKEQGLITRATAPASAFRIAMGYGCPDTAPCEAEYYGFGNQVYRASWQFNAYRNPANGFYHRPGNISVRYHPNAACGGKVINIKNWATAALYSYTPYQPNPAAMSSYPGVGDSCSSYGNRNFWFLYNDWFGKSSAVNGGPDIQAHFDQMGGESGPLGAIVANHNCVTGGFSCFQEHANGTIYWNSVRGAQSVLRVIDDAFNAAGGPHGYLGHPITSEQDQSGVSANGRVQAFLGGSIYSGPHGAFGMPLSVRAIYWQLASTNGRLGWPTTGYECVPGNRCSQEFEGGEIFTAGDIAFMMTGAIGEKFNSVGGKDGQLGYPVNQGAHQDGGENGDGRAQGFEHGSIYEGPPGAFVVKNPIRSTYWLHGSTTGEFGWPTADEVCAGGYCAQTYQLGVISINPGGTPMPVRGMTGEAYLRLGGPNGPMGFPTNAGASQAGGSNGNGFAQAFQNGSIYSGPPGAFSVSGEIRARFWALGSTAGTLGWPTAEPQCEDGSCAQKFQGGSVFVGSTGQAHVLPEETAEAYLGLGGPSGPLGYPTNAGAPQAGGANGDGFAQAFVGGSIYVGPPGAFSVSGDIRSQYWALGSTRGSLGWPIAEPVCDASGCSQRFEGGVILAPSAGSAFTVHSAVTEAYQALGGPNGVMGFPTNAGAIQRGGANGDGFAQAFRGGSIYAGPPGAYSVRSEIRAHYWTLGSTQGMFGWPTSEQVCDASGCSQDFQGGSIFLVGGRTYTLLAAVRDAYEALGGPSSTLGYPANGGAVQTGAANGDGFAQAFQGGSIYAGPPGAFSVSGPLRAQYWALGSTRGSLGWPIAEPECADGVCTQQFQGGNISVTP